jgi:nuclease S1
MVKRWTIGVACLMVIVWSAVPGRAWGPVGHRVVARIAASQLTTAAKDKVAKILEPDKPNVDVAEALADAAEWPDIVARDKFPDSQEWHFIDLGVKPHAQKDGALWVSDSTAFAKLVKYFGSVKRGDTDELESESDLKFLVHLVGDIHQPLHSATNRDRGGNCLFVTFRTSEGDTSARKKFHGTMDSGILDDRHAGNDRVIASQFVRDARDKIVAETKRAHDQLVADPAKTIRAWIEESHALAVTELYGKLKPPVPQFVTSHVSSDCHEAAPVFKGKGKTWTLKKDDTNRLAQLIDRQLVMAGARLAALLNAVSE